MMMMMMMENLQFKQEGSEEFFILIMLLDVPQLFDRFSDEINRDDPLYGEVCVKKGIFIDYQFTSELRTCIPIQSSAF